MEGTVVVAGGIPAGVVFGGIRSDVVAFKIGQDPLELDVFLENPQVPIRMVAHWSYFRDFSVTDGVVAAETTQFSVGKNCVPTIPNSSGDWVRMQASCGWNALCPSEINWH